ncbi:MAG: hypothetical protein HY953_03725, partial [Candidatus Rokubacteria bacterium]|nr:hypothetical protein [Candidatus Rokubacteria bacterium]
MQILVRQERERASGDDAALVVAGGAVVGGFVDAHHDLERERRVLVPGGLEDERSDLTVIAARRRRAGRLRLESVERPDGDGGGGRRRAGAVPKTRPSIVTVAPWTLLRIPSND